MTNNLRQTIENWSELLGYINQAQFSQKYRALPIMINGRLQTYNIASNIYVFGFRTQLKIDQVTGKQKPRELHFTKMYSTTGMEQYQALKETRIKKAQAEKEGISEQEVLQKRIDAIPAKRLGKPEEYGYLAAFLASDYAAYLTGTTIPLDGGNMKSIL